MLLFAAFSAHFISFWAFRSVLIIIQYFSGAAEVMDDTKGWGIHFIEVLDGVLYICPSKQQRNRQTTTSLADSFISITGKRCIVIENQRDGLIIRTNSEVQAQKWLMVLSQYCFVAPSIEGRL